MLAACGAQRLSGSPCQRRGPAMAGAPAAGARYGTETSGGRQLRPAGLGGGPGARSAPARPGQPVPRGGCSAFDRLSVLNLKPLISPQFDSHEGTEYFELFAGV